MSHPPKTMSSSCASGTNSLILGVRLSVRLPSRIVPICVSDPMGFARPLRMATTPAIVVVLTAPRPTRRMPNLPWAGAISKACFTLEIYHHEATYHGRTMMFLLRMLMRKGRGASMDPLHVSMTGVRMGERFLQIGVHDKALLAGLAAKVGLSGTSAVAALDAGDAKRARAIGAKVGALIEVHEIDEGRAWPIADAQFDMVVVDDSQDTFWSVDKLDDLLRNALGALRPGGRIEVV